MMPRRVLVVEDNADIARLLAAHLTEIGCEAEIEPNGAAALERCAGRRFDLVVLDLMLPGMDGITLCQRLRQLSGSWLPVLMLTARTSEVDRVLGLEVGADDYVCKPFSIPEVLARVKALFRRVDALGASPSSSHPGEEDVLTRGGLRIDRGAREVTVAGEPVVLTAKEFDLLAFFARRPGRVYSRAELLDAVWGTRYEGYEHTVNSHINRLRAKIEADPARPRYVVTVWGVGYKLDAAPLEGPGSAGSGC